MALIYEVYKNPWMLIPIELLSPLFVLILNSDEVLVEDWKGIIG